MRPITAKRLQPHGLELSMTVLPRLLGAGHPNMTWNLACPTCWI